MVYSRQQHNSELSPFVTKYELCNIMLKWFTQKWTSFMSMIYTSWNGSLSM